MIPGEALILALLLLLFPLIGVFREEPEWQKEREQDEREWLHEAYEDYERPSYEPQEVES